MAVIPGSSSPVPDGGNTSDLGGVSWMQDVTEGSVRQNAYNQVFPSMQGAKESLLGNLLGGFFGVLTGIFTGALSIIPSWFPSTASEFAQGVRDGQEDLANRADLLEGVRGYCAAYQSLNINSEWNVLSSNDRYLPYDAPLGPSKGAHVEKNKNIVMDEEGLWLVFVQAHARSTSFTGGNLSAIYVTVMSPSGAAIRDVVFDVPGGSDWTSLGGSFPVVVPEPGCWIRVRAWSGRWRWWDGGAKNAWMAVVKQDNRLVNPGSNTVPDETQ
jgi:hypothetical protein